MQSFFIIYCINKTFNIEICHLSKFANTMKHCNTVFNPVLAPTCLMDCYQNTNYCNHSVDPSPRRMLIHQNNSVLFIMKALQGYRVKSNAEQTALIKYINCFTKPRPTQMYCPQHTKPNGLLLLTIGL